MPEKVDQFCCIEHFKSADYIIILIGRTEWMRKVEGAKWEAQRPADRSEAAHAERMALLDKERYALGKSINELELAIQREEAVSAQTRTRSESINSRINAIGAEASELSRDRVRSLVFRGEIGLSWAIEELDSDKNFKNQPNKCRVISKLHNDIHTITFPPNLCDGPQSNSVNAYESTKRLWDAISPPSLKTNRD